MRSRLPGSGCHFERLDVTELSQERVLIVVATARYDPPLLVEVADLAEWQRHLAPSRPHRTERPVVGAFDGELGDDNVSRVGILGIGDAAVREGLGPCLRPFPERLPRAHRDCASVIAVGEVLGGFLDDAREVALVPALMRGTEHFDIFRTHPGCLLSQRARGRAGRVRPALVAVGCYAAFSAATLWAVEVWTLKVLTSGPASSKCCTIFCTASNCSRS